MNFLRQRSKEHFLSNKQLSDGFHLACETVINDDLKVQVPAESLTIGQVLQVEGSGNVAQPDPLIIQKTVKLREPALNDLDSDLSRLQQASNIFPLNASLDLIRRIPSDLA